MVHWLSEITRLFTCDSTDLADLAKEVGYDPETFYVGTLSKAEIDRLLARPQPTPAEDRPFEITGTLGPALAYLPIWANSSQVIECEVRLFRDHFALQEAFFAKELPANVCIVLRPSDGGPVHMPDLSLTTPVLEILSRESMTLLLADAFVFDLKGGVPVVANFSDRREDRLSILTLADSNWVQFNPATRTILVAPQENRGSAIAPEVRLSAIQSRLGQGDRSPLSYYLDTIRTLQSWCSEISSNLRRKGARRPRRHDPYFRLFHNTCTLLLRVCNEIKTLDPELIVDGFRVPLFELAENLEQCARAARTARSHQIAEHGFLTLIEVIQLCERFAPQTSYLYEAHDALARLYIQSNQREKAIDALLSARSLLSGLDVASPIAHAERAALLLCRLASQYRCTGNIDEAEECLAEANKAITSVTNRWQSHYVLIVARSHIFDELVVLASNRGNVDEAIELSRQRVDALDNIRYLTSRTPNFRQADLFSKIFQRHADLLEAESLFEEAFVAKVAATLLHLDRHGHSLTNPDKLGEVERELKQLRDTAKIYMQRRRITGAETLDAVYAEYGLEFQNWSPEAVWATLRAIRWRLGPILPDIVNLFGERDMLFEEPGPRDRRAQ
ncbi:hypothetical protein [Rhizobium leguminosarum]|uniref:hypothetical protein n=1 Tax=Rhizobium leguminosarum TaxID=384 RepID=UPI0004880B70|nr:hypothetical protein [Rhizobium leguminosarum]